MALQSKRSFYHTRHRAQLKRNEYGDAPPPTFLGIPLEVREMIYGFVFVGLKLQTCPYYVRYLKVLQCRSEQDKKALGLLCTNKQVRNEARKSLLQNCEIYFLNRRFPAPYEKHKHVQAKGMRLPTNMYQDLRHIWITTAHLKSWNQHPVLQSLRNLTVINIEHNMSGGWLRFQYRCPTCSNIHGLNPPNRIDDEGQKELVNLSIREITGSHTAQGIQSGCAAVRKLLDKSAQKPGDLQVHIHLRCPFCICPGPSLTRAGLTTLSTWRPVFLKEIMVCRVTANWFNC